MGVPARAARPARPRGRTRRRPALPGERRLDLRNGPRPRRGRRLDRDLASASHGRIQIKREVTMTPLWRKAYDAIERPLAAGSEAWIQSETFMDLATHGFRIQRRMLNEV